MTNVVSSSWVEYVVRSFGYLGLAALMFLENLFPPIPSEVILPLAGFLVGRGELGFVLALIAATTGSLVGALVLYALGRWGGRTLVLRYGGALRVGEADLDRAEGWFERYGNWIVLFARVLPFARSIVSIPAGILEMPMARFSLLTTIGTTAWNTLLLGAGWFLGENWSRVNDLISPVSIVLLIFAAMVVVGFVVRQRRGRAS